MTSGFTTFSCFLKTALFLMQYNFQLKLWPQTVFYSMRVFTEAKPFTEKFPSGIEGAKFQLCWYV